MNQKAFSLTAGIIFFIIALVHLTRIIMVWNAVVGSWAVPMWVSWIAVLIAGYLAYQGLKFGRKPQ
ncbi:MAG: hypothetical protein KJI71_02305 [Patescibacteria group bacterium]|nr:hypothetical protein [Patescibacteria group bacterium]